MDQTERFPTLLPRAYHLSAWLYMLTGNVNKGKSELKQAISSAENNELQIEAQWAKLSYSIWFNDFDIADLEHSLMYHYNFPNVKEMNAEEVLERQYPLKVPL